MGFAEDMFNRTNAKNNAFAKEMQEQAAWREESMDLYIADQKEKELAAQQKHDDDARYVRFSKRMQILAAVLAVVGIALAVVIFAMSRP